MVAVSELVVVGNELGVAGSELLVESELDAGVASEQATDSLNVSEQQVAASERVIVASEFEVVVNGHGVENVHEVVVNELLAAAQQGYRQDWASHVDR